MIGPYIALALVIIVFIAMIVDIMTTDERP